MKKFKLTHLIGMVLLFWSASPAVQAVQPDYKYGDLRVTDQNAHREVIIDKATFDSLPCLRNCYINTLAKKVDIFRS